MPPTGTESTDFDPASSFLDALLFMGSIMSLLLVLIPDTPSPRLARQAVLRRACCCTAGEVDTECKTEG